MTPNKGKENISCQLQESDTSTFLNNLFNLESLNLGKNIYAKLLIYLADAWIVNKTNVVSNKTAAQRNIDLIFRAFLSKSNILVSGLRFDK